MTDDGVLAHQSCIQLREITPIKPALATHTLICTVVSHIFGSSSEPAFFLLFNGNNNNNNNNSNNKNSFIAQNPVRENYSKLINLQALRQLHTRVYTQISLKSSIMHNGLAYAICRKQTGTRQLGLLAERMAVFPWYQQQSKPRISRRQDGWKRSLPCNHWSNNKIKNPRNVCPLVSVTRQNIAVVADSRMVPCSLLRMKLQVLLLVVVVVVVCFLFFVLPFVCFSSSLLQCTSCALNYYSISLLSEREYVCA